MGVLWKPSSDGGLNPGGTSFLLPSDRPRPRKVSVYGQDNTLLEDFAFGSSQEGAHKFYSRRPGGSYGQNVQVRVDYGTGTPEIYDIENPGLRYEGDVGGALSVSNKPMSGGGAFPPGFAPGAFGYGAYPGYLGGMYPSPVFVDYKNIKPAPYQYTDPFKFAERYGEFSRDQVRANFDLSQDLALDQLDTELKGLQNFVPAASALKRSEVSLDNIFNQEQRTRQIQQALPDVPGQLAAQADRATAYAEGRIPDTVQDRALELGIRSEAADRASAGGFGVSSSVARKTSDLMSAEARINLSRYGDQLLSQNIQQRVNTLMAPTEYSNAGQQVQVMPSLSPSQISANLFGTAMQYGAIPASTAFGSEIQQQQFKTQLVQGTRQFNAANRFQESQINAGIANQFALGLFGYNVGYAGALAGAMQTDMNAQLALQQQAMSAGIFQDYYNQAQQSQQAGGIASAAAALPSIIESIGSTISSVGSMLTGGDSGGGASSQYPSGTDYGGAPDSIIAPSVESTPSGFTPVGTSAGGGVIAVPNESYNSGSLSSFSNDTGISTVGYTPASSAATISQSGSVLRSAGIIDTPAVNFQPIGNDNGGRPQYANSQLMRSVDINTGSNQVQTLQGVLSPMGVFSNEQDRSTLQTIAGAASDASLIAQLGDAYQRHDKKGFINTLLSAVQQPTINALTKDPQNQAGLAGAFTAYQIMNNWDRMSPAQKSLAIANLGIQGYKFSTGENLANKLLVKDPTIKGGGLTVGQGLALFQAGYNTYSIVKNWDQLNTLQKVAGGTGTVAQLAELGRQFNMLGAGTTGAAVQNVTAAGMQALGYSSAPHLGVGAMVGEVGSTVPAGYTAVASSQGGQVIVPVANADSAAAASSQAGSMLGTAAGVASIAAGAYAVYQGWGAGGTKGATNGALGGSAMAAGLYQLGATNPYLLAAVVATSVLGNSINVGKSKAQGARDSVRSAFMASGFIGDDYQVTLADGSKFDIGVDGHGQQHSVSDPSKLVGDDKNRTLNAWDIDYTNDLDYSAGMGGIALSRLLTGGKETNIDQLGGQLGNAALSSVGHGKDYSPENFGAVMGNMRAMYAQAGIKSKADAFQLANQAFAEGRIDETDLVSMHQAFNMVFDNDYALGQKLMAGRWRGVEVASEAPKGAGTEVKTPEGSFAGVEVTPGSPAADMTQAASRGLEAGLASGSTPSGSIRNTSLGFQPGGANAGPMGALIGRLPGVTADAMRQNMHGLANWKRSKEDLRNLNAQRYGVAA